MGSHERAAMSNSTQKPIKNVNLGKNVGEVQPQCTLPARLKEIIAIARRAHETP